MSQDPYGYQPGPGWPQQPAQQPPRRRRHTGRNIGLGVTAAVILLAATIGISLLVMGKNPVSSVAAAVNPSPPTCHQQYESWKKAAAPQARKMKNAVKRVESASHAADITRMESGLKSAGRAASALRRSHPVPRCADPAGYYSRFLGYITASGDNARSASGLGGLILAEVPLKRVVPVEKKLDAELDRTVGKHR